MKKFIIGLGILVILLLMGLIALPSFIPSSVYKDAIETQLTRELARDVKVEGEIKLSVFPIIKANAGRVEIDNPEGFEDDIFAEMDGMSARIKLRPLFSKRVEIAAFTLKNPVINLEKRADGSANWAFKEGAPPETNKDDPFKRDGRYNTLDPNIGQFTLENGAITYRDRQSGTALSITEANVDFSLPSLAEPISLKGSLIYEGTPATLDVTLDSIRAFLDGKDTPISLNLKTDFTDIKAKGRFLPGPDIAFNLDIEGDISDAAKLVSLAPENIPYADMVDRATLTGNYNYDGITLTAKGANISAQGQDFTGTFKGDATLSETPVFDGTVSLEAQNIAALAKKFGQDVKALSLLNDVNISVDLTGRESGFTATNINALMTGSDFEGSFKGRGTFADALSTEGEFSTSIGSVADLLAALEIEAPQAKAIKTLNATGNIAFAGETITLSNLDAKTEGGALSGTYQGGATLGDVPAFDGNFDMAISSLSDFAKITATDIPYADTIGKIAVTGTLSGQGENITLPTLSAALSEGQINGRYDGKATWNRGASLDGNLNIDIPSLRTVAKSAGTELPPSTEAGTIFERFSVNGTVKGTPETIQFNQAQIVMDDIKGQGDLAVNMKATKPFVTALINLAGLDLSPYMAAYSAQNPTGEIQPWSTAPINTAPLRTIDGDFTLNTPTIKTDRLAMGQSEITATLRGGVLATNMPNVALYGGLGRMIATLDGSKTEPRVALDIGLNDVNSNSFLASAAGFTQAEGELGSSFKISGQGSSQAAIMKSLNGAGDFKLANGLIKGVDLSALLTGLDQAFTSRSIPTGIGPSHITKFNDLAGLVKIENGVASVNKFSLQGLGVLAEGSGQIDFGNQNIDFGLRPRLTGETASNLAAFGIPIKIQGGFGNTKVGLDADMLGQIAAEKARAEAQKLIKDQVGGTVGDILGGVIGGSPDPSSGGTTETSSPKPEEEIINNVLGGLLSGTKAPAPTPAEPAESAEDKTEEPKAEEPTVEDALLSIFGKKKEKTGSE